MIGLPTDLINHIREKLTECEEFKSHESLRAVFDAEELYLFQSGIPEVDDRKDRVNQIISYLRSKTLDDGRHVLPIFIGILGALRSEEDPLHNELYELKIQVDQALKSGTERDLAEDTIEIPIVVAAMTQQEADSLESGKAFSDPRTSPLDRDLFQEFKGALSINCIVEWKSDYTDRRDGWTPRISRIDGPEKGYGSYPTIEDIIDRLILRMNEFHADSGEGGKMKLYSRRSFSESFFKKESMLVRKEIKDSGCILVIDAISIFHPILRKILTDSGIVQSRNTAVIVIYPINQCQIPTNSMIEKLLEKQMEDLYCRSREDLNEPCEIGVADLRALERRLFSTFPFAADIIEKNIVKANRSGLFPGKKPRGINIFKLHGAGSR